jgi:hypothetical protein
MKNFVYAIKNNESEKQIRRTEINGTVWWVPKTPGNRHYDEYLEWLAEGNEPEIIEDVEAS